MDSMQKTTSVVLISSILLIVFSIFLLDRHIASVMQALPIAVKLIAKELSQVIDPATVLVLVPLSLLFIKKSQLLYFRITSLIVSIAVAVALVYCLKGIFTRTRPDLFLNGGLYRFFTFHFSTSYYSFPSSHAASAGALSCGIALIFPKYKKTWIVLGAIFAMTRVVLNQHFLSDVIAGYTLGAFSAYTLVFRSENLFQWLQNQLRRLFK